MIQKLTSLKCALALLLALSPTLASCGGIGSFSFTEESEETTIEGDRTGLLGDAFGALDLNVDLEEELEERDAKGAREVNLTGMSLHVTDDSDGRDFDFLSSLELSADAEGLDEKVVATIDDVPEGQESIDLDTDDEVDLKPYIEEGMSLKTDAEGNIPDEDTTIYAEVTLHVRVV